MRSGSCCTKPAGIARGGTTKQYARTDFSGVRVTPVSRATTVGALIPEKERHVLGRHDATRIVRILEEHPNVPRWTGEGWVRRLHVVTLRHDERQQEQDV